MAELDSEGKNCLRDTIIEEPVGLADYPGQRNPPTAKCQSKGRCYVNVAKAETCDRVSELGLLL